MCFQPIKFDLKSLPLSCLLDTMPSGLTAGGIVHVEAFHQITKLDNPLSSEVIISWYDEVKPEKSSTDQLFIKQSI